MATLKSVRRAMYLRPGSGVGRTEAIASLTAQTAVVTALATGTRVASWGIGKWLIRAEGAAADRSRLASNFASSTGTFTHAGAAYTDTTATSEYLEIAEYEPYIIDNAIQVTLPRIKRLDREIIPAKNDQRVYLTNLSWIREPANVSRIAWSSDPGLCRNPALEKYNTVNTSGVLQPDGWTIAGASATMARSTTQLYKGKYSLAITRAGTDCTVSQAPGLLQTGVSDDSLLGKTVTAWARVWSAVASQVRVQLYDDVNASVIASSSYHTGGSGWEELSTAETTLASTVEGLTVRVSVEGSNTVCYVDHLDGCRGALTDGVRRGNYSETDYGRPEFDQGLPLSFLAPGRSSGQWVVYSERGYAEFDSARLIAGTADADETDAPEIIAATGAHYALYEGIGDMAKAREWRERFESLALQHRYIQSEGPTPLGIPQRSIPWFSAGRAG